MSHVHLWPPECGVSNFIMTHSAGDYHVNRIFVFDVFLKNWELQNDCHTYHTGCLEALQDDRWTNVICIVLEFERQFYECDTT